MKKITEYNHIIWDWNGTLLDDAWLGVEILNQILAKRQRPAVSMQAYQDEFCIPVKPYYEKLGFDFSTESYNDLSTEFIESYDRRRFECTLQNHAMEVLKSISRMGLSQSILTAYQQSRLEEILDFFQIRELFTQLAGLDNHHASSKEENGHRLIASLNEAPSKILLIGDTLHDSDVARAIGVDCVLIPSGHTSRTRLEASKRPVLSSLRELL